MIDEQTFKRIFVEILKTDLELNDRGEPREFCCSGRWKPREIDGIHYDGTEARCYFPNSNYLPCRCDRVLILLANAILELDPNTDVRAAIVEAENIYHSHKDTVLQTVVALPNDWSAEEKYIYVVEQDRYRQALEKVNVAHRDVAYGDFSDLLDETTEALS